MEIELIEDFKISDKDFVEVKTMGNVIEIKRNTHPNKKATIKKISSDEYYKVSTGEIFEYDKDKRHNRLDNIKAVRRSLSELRDILNANVTDVKKCRWVTLTYAENMTDSKRLYKDFKRFMTRFRRYLLKIEIANVEYIVAMEPQARGAWHCHIVFIFENNAPYIPNEDMAKLWGQGFVTVKRLDDVDNIGAYLTAYLGDMELQEAIDKKIVSDEKSVHSSLIKEVEIEIETLTGNFVKQTKKYIKGQRLKMYPTGFHLWRASRGIKKPISEKMTYKQAEKKVSSAKLTFERTVKLSEGTFETVISKKYYNTKRK